MRISNGIWGLVSSCLALGACLEPIEGNGEVLSEAREVDDFTKLRSDHSVNVEFEIDEDAAGMVELDVRADANLLEYIEIERVGSELRIDAPRQLRPTEPMLVSGVVANLSEIEADNEAQIRVTGLREEHMKVSANNSAVIELAGPGHEIVAEANNGALLELEGFSVDEADVELDNGAEAYLCVHGKVRGSVDNGAELRVSCGGDLSGVSVRNGGAVLAL